MMPDKKILIITSLYPNKVNSVRGIFVKKQVEKLKQKNEITVFATEISKTNSYEVYIEDNVEVHQTQYCFPKFIISLVYYHIAIRANLKKLIKTFQPDIIHIHDYKHIPELFVLSKLIDFNRNNVILTLHNDKQIAEKHFTHLFYKLMLKFTLKQFPKIIVVSEKVKNLISRYCNDTNKIRVIGNGVEINFPKIKKENFKDFLPHSKNAYQIITVGNLVYTKGFDLLIKAVTNLNKTGYNIELSIVGGGIEKDNLLNLINSNKMEDKIHILGVIDHNIVMNLYSSYDAFVLPSWSETFGIVYLEAMLNKLPVIGVKGEGIDGIIIDGINGFLVERKNVNELEEKIKIVIKSHNIDQITDSGYNEVIKNHLINNVIKKIEKAYEE